MKMGNAWADFLHNNILIAAITSNFVAQLLKVFTEYTRTHRINWKLAVSTGGNPSSHTSTVTTLMILFGYKYGLNSPFFTISFILAAIVVIDALSVRREVGEHSKTMNEIFLETPWGRKIAEVIDVKKFRELIGHSGLEVFMGFLLGIGVALIDIWITGK